MAGNKERWSRKELEEYVKERIPGAIVIGRKPTNKGAMVISGKSGKVLYHGSKNFDIVAQITNPKEEKRKEFHPLIDIPPEVKVKDLAENAAVYALSWLTELMELTNQKCIIKYDEDGFPSKIVSGGMEFSLNGRKIK